MSSTDLVASLLAFAKAQKVTRENVEQVLDGGLLQVHMRNGNWWDVRRNGATKRWKRDPDRIYIPIKFGFKNTSNITQDDFIDGVLPTQFYRVRPPAELLERRR